MKPGQLASHERMEAIQDAIFALASGANIDTGGGLVKRPGRFKVNLSSAGGRSSSRSGNSFTPLFSDGKLRISPGSIGVGSDSNREVIPYYPKWEDKRLNANPAPAMELADLEPGEYKAYVRFCATDGKVFVVPKDEDTSGGGEGGTETTMVPSGSDSGADWVVILFYFEVMGDGNVKHVDHRQKDGILWNTASATCTSESGSGSDGDGSDDDSDDGSGDESGDDSSDNDDSDDVSNSDDSDSDDSSDGGHGPCCPELTNCNAFVVSVGGSDEMCFEGGEPIQTAVIAVVGYVGEIKCEECYGRLWVEYGVTGLDGVKKGSSYLGFGGGQEFGQTFEIQTTACSEVEAFIRVSRFGVPIGTPSCPDLEDCEQIFKVKLPGYCIDNGECSTDVPSGSDGPDDSSGGSGDPEPPGSSDDDSSDDDSGSGSTDTHIPSGSDSKECVVPLQSSPTGQAALRCVESPETWFLDIRTITLDVTGRVSSHRIDADFVEVCVPGSILVQSVVPDEAVPVGAVVRGRQIELRVSRWPWARPRRVVVTVAGIRVGCEGERFVPRTKEQYDRSRKFWSKLTI